MNWNIFFGFLSLAVAFAMAHKDLGESKKKKELRGIDKAFADTFLSRMYQRQNDHVADSNDYRIYSERQNDHVADSNDYRVDGDHEKSNELYNGWKSFFGRDQDESSRNVDKANSIKKLFGDAQENDETEDVTYEDDKEMTHKAKDEVDLANYFARDEENRDDKRRFSGSQRDWMSFFGRDENEMKENEMKEDEIKEKRENSRGHGIRQKRFRVVDEIAE